MASDLLATHRRARVEIAPDQVAGGALGAVEPTAWGGRQRGMGGRQRGMAARIAGAGHEPGECMHMRAAIYPPTLRCPLSMPPCPAINHPMRHPPPRCLPPPRYPAPSLAPALRLDELERDRLALAPRPLEIVLRQLQLGAELSRLC